MVLLEWQSWTPVLRFFWSLFCAKWRFEKLRYLYRVLVSARLLNSEPHGKFTGVLEFTNERIRNA